MTSTGVALQVAQLPPVEVLRRVESARPSEEDVADRLHQPLAHRSAHQLATAAPWRSNPNRCSRPRSTVCSRPEFDHLATASRSRSILGGPVVRLCALSTCH